MGSSQQSWLDFSLTNNPESSFSLPTTWASGPFLFAESQSLSPLGGASMGDYRFSLVDGGSEPKLEDYLGVADSLSQFPGTGGSSVNLGLYEDDLEMKNIGGSCLDGFHQQQTDDSKKQIQVASKKVAVENFGQRTSIFRGVTRHRWTGRYEAHLWDNSCRREGQSRKGRQVYLGGYEKEEKAARAYDLAALKYWGPATTTNFSVSDYEKEMEEMMHMSRQEFVASLRRKSSGFSRGASIYRGVTRHHQHGRWQARIGRVAGNKDLYLGTFSTQEEAAEAYDIAAIKFRGVNAVTNFDITRYDVRSIATNNLPIGGAANKGKIVDENNTVDLTSGQMNFSIQAKQDQQQPSSLWAALGFQNPNISPSIFGANMQEQHCTVGPYGAGLELECSSNNGNHTGPGGYSYHGEGKEKMVYLVDESKQEERLFHQTPIFGVE